MSSIDAHCWLISCAAWAMYGPVPLEFNTREDIARGSTARIQIQSLGVHKILLSMLDILVCYKIWPHYTVRLLPDVSTECRFLDIVTILAPNTFAIYSISLSPSDPFSISSMEDELYSQDVCGGQ